VEGPKGRGETEKEGVSSRRECVEEIVAPVCLMCTIDAQHDSVRNWWRVAGLLAQAVLCTSRTVRGDNRKGLLVWHTVHARDTHARGLTFVGPTPWGVLDMHDMFAVDVVWGMIATVRFFPATG
jgi:hypothetical protein